MCLETRRQSRIGNRESVVVGEMLLIEVKMLSRRNKLRDCEEWYRLGESRWGLETRVLSEYNMHGDEVA